MSDTLFDDEPTPAASGGHGRASSHLGRRHDVLDLLDAGQDRAELDEVGLGRVGHNARERSLARAGWSPQNDEPDAIAAMECLPGSVADRQYYAPVDRGYEKEIARRLRDWKKLKQERHQEN